MSAEQPRPEGGEAALLARLDSTGAPDVVPTERNDFEALFESVTAPVDFEAACKLADLGCRIAVAGYPGDETADCACSIDGPVVGVHPSERLAIFYVPPSGESAWQGLVGEHEARPFVATMFDERYYLFAAAVPTETDDRHLGDGVRMLGTESMIPFPPSGGSLVGEVPPSLMHVAVMPTALRGAAEAAPPFAAENEPPTSSWDPIDLGPALRGERKVETSVLARSDGVQLFYPGRLHSLHGEPEAMKTFVAFLAASQEMDAGNHVVWVDYEDDDAAAVERLRQMGVEDESIRNRFLYIRDPDESPLTPGPLVSIQRTLSFNPTLVIIDSATEIMGSAGLDPKKDVDVRQAHRMARVFAEQGAAVVLIDHVPKTNGGRWSTGSERKISGLDGAGYVVEGVQAFGRGQTGISNLKVAKDRPGCVRRHATSDGWIATLTMRSDPVTGAIESTLEPFSPSARHVHLATSRRREVLLAIERDPGMTATALKKKLGGNASELTELVNSLVAEGLVEVRSGSRNSKHYHLTPLGLTQIVAV